MTKTTQWILPALKLNLEDVGFIDSYLGISDEPENYGKYIYVLTKSVTDDMILEGIYTKFSGKGFITKYTLSEEIQKDIVSPLLDGKYSRLPTEYVAYALKPYDKEGLTMIGKIYFKDDDYRKELGSDLGVWIDPNAELGSIFIQDDETFLFN